MYKKMYSVIFVLLLSINVGYAANHPSEESSQMLQCSKDTDCKGDRICEKGACTNPTPPVAVPSLVSIQAEAQPVKSTTTDTVPQFKDYPSGPVYIGRAASLANKSDPFRTRNSAALAENPVVFASEYVISTIGCGTSCVFQGFLSKRTGEQLNDGFGGENGERIKAVKPDSLLVVTAGPNDADENDPKFYAYFYILKDGKFERIFKKETTLPECEGSEGYCTVDSPY